MNDSERYPDVMMRRKPKVLLWGPFPGPRGVFGDGIGGYARCNSQMLRSQLAERATLVPLRMTVPRFEHPLLARFYLVPRMLVDMVSLYVGLLYHGPDVLHITALYWRSIYREAFAVWLARRLGVRVLYDIRAGTFERFMESGEGSTRRALDYIMRNADRITIEGERYRDPIAERYDRDARWVPNFFPREDLAKYPAAPLDEPAPDEPLRLAFVGYLIPDKGIDVLLEAAWRLRGSGPVEVTLIGAVSSRVESLLARARARETEDERYRVVVTGRLDLPELLERLRRQHVFVFLSRFFGEGHSNAVTEAMAMGLPVVTTRNGFLAEVVTNACGVIVEDSEDADEVAEALAALRADWGALRRKGENARRRIRTDFVEEAALSETAAIYDELHATRASRSDRALG